jgi:VanZ family protein
MKEKMKLYAYFSLAIAETFTLFWFSLLPSVTFVSTGGLRPGDIEHLAAYLVYGFLWTGFFRFFARITKRRVPGILLLVIPLLIGSAVGATCETLQLFVPGRVADPIDWAIDTLGAFCGAFAASKLKNLF